jgi:hypothetical protein
MDIIHEYGEQALRDLEEFLEFKAFRDIDEEALLKMVDNIHRWKLIYDMNKGEGA